MIFEFFSDLHTCLNATFESQWIGSVGQVPCVLLSLNFSILDYFLWGHLKNLVPATTFDSDEDLVARISESAAYVTEIPGIFERVHQALQRRSVKHVSLVDAI
ncbi:hypothetical protein TNCV_4476171 [Trichonephila clavipes]|nr:hypothetical protein TNCV_4476171 [Trichonephila clavipes]